MRPRRSREPTNALPALPVVGEDSPSRPGAAHAGGSEPGGADAVVAKGSALDRLGESRGAAHAQRLLRAARPPGGRGTGRSRWLRPLAVGIVVLLGAATAWRIWSGPGGTNDAAERAKVREAVDAALADADQRAQRAPAVASTVYATIQPSLVVVRTDRAAGNGATGGNHGLGAGVIVNQDGTILTALHVVADANAVRVSFADGTSAEATVEARQADHDLAVLRPAKLPEVVVPAVLGGGLNIGDDVFAVGNPLGLVGSLSAGVVSGLNRKVPIDDEHTLDGLIQFDAAVNPGNSGGPLLNKSGQVVGVVTALANPSSQGYFVGIGFAVPIQTAGGAAGGPSR